MIRMPLLIAGIATAAIVAAVGINLIGTSGDAGSGAPGKIPSPTTGATPSASAAIPTGDPVGRLLAGTHVSRLFTPRLQFEVRTGWATLDDQPAAYVLRGHVESRQSGVYCPEDGPDWGESCRGPGDEEIIVVQRGPVLATDAAGCEGRAATGAPTSIDGMSGAIAADPRLATSQRETVAISGYVGEALYVKLNPSWTKTCKWSAGKPAAMILTVAQPPGPTFGVRTGERMRLMLLDVRGDVIAIITKRTWRISSDPVVETFQFGP
jgi:hypothetical protein